MSSWLITKRWELNRFIICRLCCCCCFSSSSDLLLTKPTIQEFHHLPRVRILSILVLLSVMSAPVQSSSHTHPHKGVVRDTDGDVYEGEFDSDGKAHGHGRMLNKDGFVLYDGEWVHSHMEGEGVQRVPTALEMTYRGHFSHSARNGLGVEERADGIFEGEWVKDEKHGFGVIWTQKAGFVEVGRWEKSRFVHECVIPRRVLAQGTFLSEEAKASEFIGLHGEPIRYEGTRNSHHQPHGSGQMFNKDGVPVAGGLWKDGLLDGVGFQTMSDEAEYIGTFSAGKMHGEGALKYSDGDIYKGQFLNNARSGRGVMSFADSNIYDGEWLADAMDGIGEIQWKDGIIFEGQFTRNEKEGFGVLWDKDGIRRTTGLFHEGKFIASMPVPAGIIRKGKHLTKAERGSTLLYPDGGYYIGAIHVTDAHGFGTLYNSKGVIQSQGEWKEGKLIQSSDKPIATEATSSNTTSSSSNTHLHDEL